MDIKLLFTVTTTVFLAELGDKTQLATVLFAAKSPSARLTVFAGASVALVAAAALGVLAGGLISQFVNPRYLSYAAGAGFIAIGAWIIGSA